MLSVPVAAALMLSAAQASAETRGDNVDAARPHPLTLTALQPPADYVRENSFYGLPAACHLEGKSGIINGRWYAYLCYQELPFTPFQALYVKK